VYNFGFAIHEDFTNARFHYVSLGYQFGLDKANPGVKNYIDVRSSKCIELQAVNFSNQGGEQ
jgi:hypothetical protein